MICLAALVSTAQVKIEKRIEFELKDGYSGERIMPFEDKGVMVRTTRIKTINRKSLYKYELYSTDLELVETENLELGSQYNPDESFETRTHSYTIFTTKRGEFALARINASNLEIDVVKGELPGKMRLTQMAVVGDYAYFTAYDRMKSYVVRINTETGKLKQFYIQVTGFKDKFVGLQGFQVLEESNELFVFIRATKKKEKEFHVLSYDEDGHKQLEMHFAKNREEHISDMSVSKTADDEYVFTGTYFTGKTGNSEGLYFSIVDGGKEKFINFINFLELENFLNYLPEKTQERIERKKNRKESRGKSLNINYRMASHAVRYVNDQYIYLGEAYYPTYRTETYTVSTANGPVTRTRTVFDGYQYTHAVLASFNEQGEIEWDNIFRMYPSTKPFYVKRFINVNEENTDEINMVFGSGRHIVSTSFDYEGEELDKKEYETNMSQEDGDKLKRSTTNMNYWYDNYFMAYGYQVIKNKGNRDVKRKRRVFYMTKISYE